MALETQTVAIPFADGIKPSTRARTLAPQQLQTAQNCYFFYEQGPQKRNGHEAHVVRTGAPPVGLGGIVPPTGLVDHDTFDAADPGLAPSYLFGWGLYDEAHTQANTTAPLSLVSPQPDVGMLRGMAQRDGEIVAWDGHRMFSYAARQPTAFGDLGTAVMPALRSAPIAKTAARQVFPDAADGGAVRTVAWIVSTSLAGYSVYDSSNGTCLVHAAHVAGTAIVGVRVVTVGAWTHVVTADTGPAGLVVRSFHQDAPSSVTVRSIGDMTGPLDVEVISDSAFAVVRVNGTSLVLSVHAADGSTSYMGSVAVGAKTPAAGVPVAVAADRDGLLGVVWGSSAVSGMYFAQFTQTGVLTGTVVTLSSPLPTNLKRVALAPRWVRSTTGRAVWDVYYEAQNGGGLLKQAVYSTAVVPDAASPVGYQTIRYNTYLCSRAFRVGNRTFVWTSPVSHLQTQWVLCDAELLPVGHMSFGLAGTYASFATDRSQTLALPGVNWRTSGGAKDRMVFCGALGYVVRPVADVNGFVANGAFSEPSIQFYELDFLPRLRSAQAGRATYFAGAQLWAFDGARVDEAGFLMAPEENTFTLVPGAAGSVTNVYRWRVDLVHKNAQGEEVRSFSLISPSLTYAHTDASCNMVLSTVPCTRRADAYFLIYRTEANGDVFYLVNSRDPADASFRYNDMDGDQVTFSDTVSDAVLVTREQHPANGGGAYLNPLPAPACEVVAGGRDRLWLAGGELAPGDLAPSRLFYPGETPSFSPALNVQVDRGAEPITAIGFVGPLTVAFRRTQIYVVEGDGPDNSFQGAWVAPRLAYADIGAIGPEGLALTTVGLWFQSLSGLRLLQNSGTLDGKAGSEVDSIAQGAKFAGAVVLNQMAQVRWYSRDGNDTFVVNYRTMSWSTWTGLACAGAAFWPVTSLAVCARGDGALWVERQGLYTDAGAPFEMVVKTAWLHARDMGDFQRVRRFALFGLASPLTLRVRVFYDERPFHDEEIVRTYPAADESTLPGAAALNDSTWGLGTWGDSTWGDAADAASAADHGAPNASALWFRDHVFRMRFRPARQKCSVFAVEFSDSGCTNAGFQPIALALELGVKTGLDRIPTNG